MLENPEILRKLIEKTGANSTDLESPEEVEHLCSKCDLYAKEWAKEAEKIWDNKKGKSDLSKIKRDSKKVKSVKKK